MSSKINEPKFQQPPRSGLPAGLVVLAATFGCAVSVVMFLSWVFERVTP